MHRRARYPSLRQQQHQPEGGGADLRPRRGCHGNDLAKSTFTSAGSYAALEHRYGHKENQCSAPGGRGLPTSQNQEVVSPRQPQLCYTPASSIPLSEYVSVDDDRLWSSSPDGSTATAAYSGPVRPDRAEAASYTVLGSVDTSQPVTAIFMGFQLTQDDSGQTPESEASLEAELVFIDGDDGATESDGRRAASSAGGEAVVVGGARRAQVATGIRKIPRNHKACCSVC